MSHRCKICEQCSTLVEAAGTCVDCFTMDRHFDKLSQSLATRWMREKLKLFRERRECALKRLDDLPDPGTSLFTANSLKTSLAARECLDGAKRLLDSADLTIETLDRLLGGPRKGTLVRQLAFHELCRSDDIPGLLDWSEEYSPLMAVSAGSYADFFVPYRVVRLQNDNYRYLDEDEENIGAEFYALNIIGEYHWTTHVSSCKHVCAGEGWLFRKKVRYD